MQAPSFAPVLQPAYSPRSRKAALTGRLPYEYIHASFADDALKEHGVIIPGSLRHGIVEFRKSPEWWTDLKPNSRTNYNKTFDWLLTPPGIPKNADPTKPETMRHKGHGHRPFATMDQEGMIYLRNLRYNPPEDMRYEYPPEDKRYERSRSGVFPGAANMLVTALGALSAFVKLRRRKFRLPRGWRSPTEGVPMLKGGDGYRPWEEEEIEDFYKRWPPETIQRVIFDVFLDTGQRGIDVWGMKRKHYRLRKLVSHDGTGIWTAQREISVVQEKTRERIWIPAADELMPSVDWLLQSHSGEWFFVTQAGEHMSQGYMTKILRDAIADAGLPDDCHPHGLRVTFATRMIEWGLPHDTIESIVGHTTFQMAVKYTEKRRKARFGVATMNRGLAAHRAGQELLVEE